MTATRTPICTSSDNPGTQAAARRRMLFALLAAPLLCSLALAVPPAQAATRGSGTAATETRTPGEFQAVNVAGSMDLVVRQGAQHSVQVQADDNLLPLLETVVENGRQGPTLMVRWKRGESLYHRVKVLVTVITPKLTGVSAAGNGDIKVETFNTPSLQLSLAGSGNARLEGLITEDLGISISGSGNVAGKGSATKLAISIAGSGDVQLTDLKSDDASISIAGSGDARVNAQKTLNVRIAGSGDVTYTGNATLSSKVAGSGNVSKK